MICPMKVGRVVPDSCDRRDCAWWSSIFDGSTGENMEACAVPMLVSGLSNPPTSYIPYSIVKDMEEPPRA